LENNGRLCRLSIGVAGITLGMSLAGAVCAKTENIVGGVTDVSESTGNDYSISKKAVVNFNGADVGSVVAADSTINIEGGSVGKDAPGGLILHASVLHAEGTVISNAEGTGLRLISDLTANSNATLNNSKVFGVGIGVLVGKSGDLALSNTEVIGAQDAAGKGVGINVADATATLTEGSYVRGDSVGVLVTQAGGLPTHGKDLDLSVVNVDDSIVQSTYGAAIKVDEFSHVGSFANINVQNHSTLLSGNGNLLEVEHASTAKFTVDNSTLTGNLVADDTSTLNVTLQNNAQLTGDVINSNSLTINSGAQWQMVGDNSVATLALNRGTVSFGDGFHTLSLGELSGYGTFAMNTDLAAGIGDLLVVNGEANGYFTLKVKNTGVEPVSPDIQPLQVVHTEGGDAQFNLLGNRVDLGAYSYELEKQGTDWFIVGSGKIISPSTQSVLALFNAAPTIWMSELTTLRSRMGEVRNSGEGGGWIRAYGSRFNATTGAGVDYEQRQSGMSFGADAPVPVSNGQLLIGLLGGYSKSDLDLSRGTSGNVDSYYVGAYGTWLSEEGYYVDGVLKLNKFHNESEVAMSDQTKAKGNYANTGIGGSVEFGKHIKLADDFFLEPFAQMAAVVIQGDHYTLDNGLEAKSNRTQSVLGKVGTSVGRNIALKDGGVLQPYVRVAVAHEFARSNEVRVNDTRFNNELFGSRAELGAGVAVSLSKRLQVHADFDYMKGNNVEQPWGANVGVRFAF
jgi:outer membrane autotransporter protein